MILSSGEKRQTTGLREGHSITPHDTSALSRRSLTGQGWLGAGRMHAACSSPQRITSPAEMQAASYSSKMVLSWHTKVPASFLTSAGWPPGPKDPADKTPLTRPIAAPKTPRAANPSLNSGRAANKDFRFHCPVAGLSESNTVTGHLWYVSM